MFSVCPAEPRTFHFGSDPFDRRQRRCERLSTAATLDNCASIVNCNLQFWNVINITSSYLYSSIFKISCRLVFCTGFSCRFVQMLSDSAKKEDVFGGRKAFRQRKKRAGSKKRRLGCRGNGRNGWGWFLNLPRFGFSGKLKSKIRKMRD